MRTLLFDPWTEETPESAVRFTHLYQLFLGAADQPNRATSLEETAMALTVLDAFDSISDVMHTDAMGEVRRLKSGGGVMLVPEGGLALLQRTVDAYVATVPFVVARQALGLKAFVDSAGTL